MRARYIDHKGRGYALSGPGAFEGLTAFETFLAENVDQLADETSGDVEAPTGWFALVGRHVMSTDCRGFWYAARFATRAEAAAAFAEAEAAYCAWADDGDPEAENWTDEAEASGLSDWAQELRAAENFYADGDLFGNDGTC